MTWVETRTVSAFFINFFKVFTHHTKDFGAGVYKFFIFVIIKFIKIFDISARLRRQVRPPA